MVWVTAGFKNPRKVTLAFLEKIVSGCSLCGEGVCESKMPCGRVLGHFRNSAGCEVGQGPYLWLRGQWGVGGPQSVRKCFGVVGCD